MIAPRCLQSILILLAVLSISSIPASGQPTSSRLLADDLTKSAREVLEADSLTTKGLEVAVALLREAALLDPGDPGRWRTLLKTASLADRKDLGDQALRTLLQLDPNDEVARLLRLTEAIDQYQTLEQRHAAYLRLLSDDNRRHLGPTIASRLALDLAMLFQRAGDTDAFGQWLAEAGVLDPANREASALAAGFFSARQSDPFAEAELLCNHLMADPTDLASQAQLARLLTDAGAYQGAARILTLLKSGMRAEGGIMADDMLADLAMVTWATGRSDEAIKMILQRRSEHDLAVRRQAAIDQPTLRMHELGRLFAPKNLILSTVQTAIRNRQDAESATPGLLEIQAISQQTLTELNELEDAEAHKAQLHLESAWINIWLGADVAASREALSHADASRPLTDEARTRFEGWFALRGGDPRHAVELLEPIAPSDPAALLGLALARLELDETREGARHLLSVAREQPGSLMGIWAADLLSELLGQRMRISELAQRLNDLIRSLPASFDRIPDHPTSALGFEVQPTKRQYDPYEPILIDLAIHNHAVVPLAIDPAGPIRPQIILFPSLQFAGLAADVQPDPIVVDIDRLLRLESGQREIIRIDLRRYGMGGIIDANALSGCGISLTGMINVHLNAHGSLEPGLLGSADTPSLVRINGLRITDSWFQRTLSDLESGEGIDPRRIALLSQAVVAQAMSAASPSDRPLLDQAKAAVRSAFPELDPIERAWVLSVMPRDEAFESVFNMARKSTHRLVKIAYLLHQNTGLDDPMLDAAMRGDDAVIRAIAEMLREFEENDSNPSSSADDGSP